MWKTAPQLQYPYLTVCHPRYFDKAKLEEHGINDTLANYMVVTLDPGMNLMRALASGEEYAPAKEEVFGLEADLQALLKGQNITLAELFKKVAIG